MPEQEGQTTLCRHTPCHHLKDAFAAYTIHNAVAGRINSEQLFEQREPSQYVPQDCSSPKRTSNAHACAPWWQVCPAVGCTLISVTLSDGPFRQEHNVTSVGNGCSVYPVLLLMNQAPSSLPFRPRKCCLGDTGFRHRTTMAISCLHLSGSLPPRFSAASSSVFQFHAPGRSHSLT